MTSFVLAGNGTWLNRGCEAIERATIDIVNAAFEDASFVVAPFGQEPPDHTSAFDPSIPRALLPPWTSSRRTPQWLWRAALGVAAPRQRYKSYRGMFGYLDDHIESAAATLSVGGDNYSLDWGPPDLFWGLDRAVRTAGKPIVLWGSSVGPFSDRPRYERFAIDRLKAETCIMARESLTVEYLAEHGVVDNVVRVADPAFVMDPVEPDPGELGVDSSLIEGAIGLNLAPLLGKYMGHEREKRVALAAQVIEAVVEEADRPIVLVPHVVYPPHNDDYQFMAEALDVLGDTKVPVELLSRDLAAREIKWVIGQLGCLVASRMHCAIAGLSSGVPTLAIAYSMKAHGVIGDIFGNTDLVLPVDGFAPNAVREGVGRVLADEQALRDVLARRIPEVRELAMQAGTYLADVLE